MLDINDVYTENGSPILRSQYVEMHKFADPTAAFNQSWCQRDAFVIRLPELYFIAVEALMQTDKKAATDLMNEFCVNVLFQGKKMKCRYRRMS